MQAPRLVLLMPLVSMALAVLLLGSSQRLDNGPCDVPGPYTLCTIPPCTFLGKMSCLVSKFASQDISFWSTCGSIGLPGYDLVLGSHAVSVQSRRPRLEWIASTMTSRSLDAALVMLQTMHSVSHLSRSCWLHESYPLVSDLAPRGYHLQPSLFH